MRYSDLVESRSSSTTLEHIVANKDKFQAALHRANQGHVLFRGIKTAAGAAFLYGNSNDGEPRRSANTDNYYTLLIDNLPCWAQYPKRSRSFICSNHEYGTFSYGDTYVVLPFDSPKIIKCSSNDFWDAFPYLFDNTNMYDMPRFNHQLKSIAQAHGIALSDSNFSKLKEGLDQLQEKLQTSQHPEKKFWLGSSNNIFEQLNDLLDPVKNKFEILNMANYVQSSSDNPYSTTEHWFSGSAFFVKWSMYKQVLKELQ